MLNTHDYKDLLIVNSDGVIMHADFSNPSFMKLKDEPLKGRSLKDVFINIDDEHPLLRAAREGKVTRDYKAEIETCTGKIFSKTGSAYPIYKEGRPFAAIEFSDVLYDRKDVREIETLSDSNSYRENGTLYLVDDIITEDPNMIRIKKEIETVALTDFPVLLYGETGTGKELAAQALHNASRRFNKKFVSVNCGAIPESLAESMLLGTTKGSFTDSEDKSGFFEQAEGGTLFLDEINSLTPQIQVKLLRAVEHGLVRRIGDTKEKKVNVRLVTATNEDPEMLIEKNRMLSDFYHRISVSYIYLPTLKERGDDVIVLANHFIQYFNQNMKTSMRPISDQVEDVFRRYNWPGNIRELRNVIEGAFVMTENDEITIEDIPNYIIQAAEGVSPAVSEINLTRHLEQTECGLIKMAMEQSGQSLTDAAALLGISKQLLKYKLDKYSERGEI